MFPDLPRHWAGWLTALAIRTDPSLYGRTAELDDYPLNSPVRIQLICEALFQVLNEPQFPGRQRGRCCRRATTPNGRTAPDTSTPLLYQSYLFSPWPLPPLN